MYGRTRRLQGGVVGSSGGRGRIMSRVPGWLGRIGAGLTELGERLDERRAEVELETQGPLDGEDGLDTIRGIERTAHRLLRPGGIVVVEHADTQGGQVPWIFTEEKGWADAADHPDLNNRPRFATARKALP